MRTRFLSVLNAVLWAMVFTASPAAAQQTLSFAEVRAIADRGVSKVETDLFIEGIVISDAGNENLELNQNRDIRKKYQDCNHFMKN